MREIPWWKVQSTGYEKIFINRCIDDEYFNEGPLAIEFESAIRSEVNVSNAIVCSSGTAALFLALKALGVKPGDLVGVPSTTFIATANAVKLAGAVPIFIDSDLETLTISNTDLRNVLSENIIKFLIIVHVSGRSAFNSELNSIIEKNSIKVIEDAAEAFASKDPVSGKFLGTIGEVGIYSFSPNKIITSGQGGAVVTNSKDIANNCVALKDQGRPIRGTGGADNHPLEGYNFKLADINSAVALGQLKHLSKRINFLQEIYQSYKRNLQNCQHQKLLQFDTLRGELPLWPEIWSDDREKVLQKMTKNKIGFREIWHPVNSQPHYNSGRLTPNSKSISEHIFWLPSAFTLTKNDIEEITRIISCEKCSK